MGTRRSTARAQAETYFFFIKDNMSLKVGDIVTYSKWTIKDECTKQWVVTQIVEPDDAIEVTGKCCDPGHVGKLCQVGSLCILANAKHLTLASPAPGGYASAWWLRHLSHLAWWLRHQAT
jgi:hypothetical protein